MAVAIVTGSCGLVGQEVVQFLIEKGMRVVGIDNNTRGALFGEEGSVLSSRKRLIERWGGTSYIHEDVDVRDFASVDSIFHTTNHVELVVHAAGQPSHDWSAQAPLVDFDLNAVATLNLLEAVRNRCPEATFVFMSTNKVYGDKANRYTYIEMPTRWMPTGPYLRDHGFDETMSIDGSTHSPFGVSKAAADLMVQEYGRYMDIRTVCFRCGCITGGAHAGVKLHGFLAYLARCILTDTEYTILGYKGKQVRDNLHAYDLAAAVWEFAKNPKYGAVYNMGGGPKNSCSVLEAIEALTSKSSKSLRWGYSGAARWGDHRWWISDTRAFEHDYPAWKRQWSLEDIYTELLGVCNE